MKIALLNFRRAKCQLTGRPAKCVDVMAPDLGLSLTVDIKKLPDLVSNLAFQSQIASVNDSTPSVSSLKGGGNDS